MLTDRERGGAGRIVVLALVAGLAAALVYWLSTQGADAQTSWDLTTALVLAAIGAGAGAAVGSGAALARWTTWESILAAVLSGVIGVLFWAWGLTAWKAMEIVQVAVPGYGIAIADILYGFWFLAAVLVPYIVRKPGAAVAAEVVASIVSSLLGSEWGLTVLISGLVQGGLAEIVFAARGYRHYDLGTLIVAAAAAAVGSWVVDYAFWYSTLEPRILTLMLVARIFSAAVLAGLLGKVLSDALARTGVLDNTALGRERMGG